MGGASFDHQSPLLRAELGDSSFRRTGTTWTATAHIITGVIGSGVLSLAWSMAQLGWIGGPVTMLVFAAITLYSTFLLCNCYRTPDPEYGPGRNRSYLEAVQVNLGPKNATACGVLVQLDLYGIAIAYTVTAIQKSNCYHNKGHDAACGYSDTFYMLVFGALQIVLSQLPDFHDLKWLSILAAIMSFTYSSIGLGLGLAKTIGDGFVKGSISGVSASSPLEKVWLVAQAFGDVAFAYPYNVILIDIQDTLKAPPPENQTMKKASTMAIFVTTIFYLCCGGFGYAAFGDNTPGNLLTGFGFYEPYWLIDFANACIVLHLLGAYQVFSQPLFGNVERWASYRFPNNGFVNREFILSLPTSKTLRFNFLRLCFRTLYVLSTTAIAACFPYFNQVLGVLGGFYFWPLSIYFPVEMYLRQMKIEVWTKKWILLRLFSLFCLLLTILAVMGSIQGVISAKLS
ncbi:hypothetical protein ACFE04_022166 [Oxalis oulophora]